jgi:hypothetical protein
MTRSAATLRAMRQLPSTSPGSTSWPATRASRPTASACWPSNCSSLTVASTTVASPTSALTSWSRASASSHTGRLARVMIVVRGAKDQHGGGRVKPTHPADGPNQLGHRVLGGDRVVQQRGIQRPPVPPSQDPGPGDHRPHRLQDPLRPVRGPKPAAPQGQHRGMKALVGQGQPASDLPSDVLPKLRGRLPVRQPLQRLQHHDRGHLIGRDRQPTTTRREQVSEQLVGNRSLRCRPERQTPSQHRPGGGMAAASSSSTRVGSFAPCMWAVSRNTHPHRETSTALCSAAS